MPRTQRVLSFMSQWGSPRSPTTTSTAPASPKAAAADSVTYETVTPSSSATKLDALDQASSTPPRTGRERSSSRPASMIFTYQPPMMDVAAGTLPELLPIFSFLNAHSNKLYQEGYFLKLHDLDSRGRPSVERNWVECFAQLVGTVLSIWDAAALDLAGDDGEVVPTFINLADASLKMIESLPMNGHAGQSLQNVLSISTAANNRYLLHFNSLHSLTQWTAAIRLAMFELVSLQEAYTGSLIAGKGKTLNNIRQIMERSRFPTEDWARVRFGAGTPWRRCWCVITPPGEKEIKNAQKALKKRSTYDVSRTIPTGDIKFYETRKITKKSKPIASIAEAYAAYSIYPQSKPLIDQSTLVKVEGRITIHSDPPSTTEGFVFVMPEVHPAVTGFEIMLRWLFPVFDTFALYGRPDRLIPDVLDVRSLMFALPQDKRYGYLELLDVTTLIHTAGSQDWTEREWRKQMKVLTSKRMTSISQSPSRRDSTVMPRRNTTNKTGVIESQNGMIRFDDTASLRSASSTRLASPAPQAHEDAITPPRRTDSAPPTSGQFYAPRSHHRSVSDANGYKRYQTETPSRLSYEANAGDDVNPPPAPPLHGLLTNGNYGRDASPGYASDVPAGSSGRSTPGGATPPGLHQIGEDVHRDPPLVPVAAPPAFTHAPSQKPPPRRDFASDQRRANSGLDDATLNQLADATQQPSIAAAGATAAWRSNPDSNRGGLQSTGFARRSFEGSRLGFAAGAGNQGLSTDYTAFQQSVNSRYAQSQNARQLPTIPASPFVDQTNPSPDSPYFSTFAPQLPATDEMVTAMHTDRDQREIAWTPEDQMLGGVVDLQHRPASRTAQQSDPSPYTSSNQNISRKPLTPHVQPYQVAGRSSADGLERLQSYSSSDRDNASVASPDYASTLSAQSRKSVEKPRPGVLRTIGNAELLEGDAKPNSDVPAIDFGPTLSLDPASEIRPGTSRTITRTYNENFSANDPPNSSTRRTPPLVRPHDERRDSYGFSGKPSPVSRSGPDSGSRSPGSGPTTPGYDVVERDGRRTMAWSPGITVSSQPQSRQGLTAEQWVQQRAATAGQKRPAWTHQRQASGGVPVYAHQKQGVNGTPPHSRNGSNDWSQMQPSQTPPLQRSSSGDWSQVQQNRGKQRDLQYRPRPKEASAALANVDLPQHLSAREQEHVARSTGSPLLQMAGNAQLQRSPSTGLIGAIEAREREKQGIREGNRNVMVNHAIMQRQQQQRQQSQHRLGQVPNQRQMLNVPQNYPLVAAPLGLPGYAHHGGPAQQQVPQPQHQPFMYQQQQPHVWPQQQIFAQGGGWSAPTTPGEYQIPMTAGLYQQQQVQGYSPYGAYNNAVQTRAQPGPNQQMRSNGFQQ